MALLSGAGTFHRLAEKMEVTDMDSFESHTLAPLPFMEQPSHLHSGVYQRENLRGLEGITCSFGTWPVKLLL